MATLELRVRGLIANDVVLRKTQSGKSVVNLNIAHQARVRQPDGSWVDGETTWVYVSCWGDVAEYAAGLSKGTIVHVVGRPSVDMYMKKDGSTAVKLVVSAWEVTPMYKPSENFFNNAVPNNEVKKPSGGSMSSLGQIMDEEPPF